MENYQRVRVKLTNTQLKKFKSAAKTNTRIKLKTNKKNFQDEQLPHELFSKIRITTKIRNAIAKNMSTGIKLSKEQLSNVIQLRWFLRIY